MRAIERLIVDGMNVIGSRPDGWWRDRTGAMRALLGALRALEGAEVVLVLDGRERDLGPAGGVRVRWAPLADDVIARLAAPGWTVATSDAPLVARVRAAGADVVGSQTFRSRLERLVPPYGSQP